jgi:aldehyde:ferredoxin oxidoreductase
MEALSTKHGNKIGVMSIGQAGEMRLAAANISVRTKDDYIRSCGRGGLGAVMGSKKIKYITIDDTDGPGVQVADQEKFKGAAKVFAKGLVEHPVSGQALKQFGTDVLINILNEVGGLPTRNFRYGQFEGHNKISGETVYDVIVKREGKPSHGCHTGCVIQCSQVYNDADKQYVTSGFEYETIWGLGANCCIDDLDILAKADYLMDDIGIDSIETADALAVAMEAGVIPFGDGPGMLRLINEIGEGTPLGRILGTGTAAVGKVYGQTRVPVVKDQGLTAYDPRPIKGIGITYATSTMGADHTAGYCIATNVLKVGGFVDPLKKEGQVELCRNLQIATAFIDSAGLCIFVAFPTLDNPEVFPAMVDMLSAKTGVAISVDDALSLGKEILRTEHEFNLAAGFTNKHDRLPEFFEYEPIPPHNAVWDFTGEEIDSFWDF